MELHREVVRLLVAAGDEGLVDLAELLEVAAQAQDRVLLRPLLLLRGGTVAGGVVAGGVRGHAVGEGLDEDRPLPRARRVQGGAHGTEHGQDVVAVHAHRGDAPAAGALGEGDAGLDGGGHGDRPLVVLRVEDDGGLEGGGEGEGLRDLPLARGAVAEEGEDRGVGGAVAGADDAVALQAHCVADRVRGLGAEHDHVWVGAQLVGVPAAVADAAEHLQQAPRLDAAGPGDAVLAIGGHEIVLLAGGVAGPDLRGLLAERARPQAELALALQVRRLEVRGADHHHVAVVAAQPLGGGEPRLLENGVELLVRGAGAVGSQELDHRLLGRDVGDRGSEDAHGGERNLRCRKFQGGDDPARLSAAGCRGLPGSGAAPPPPRPAGPPRAR